LASAYGLAVTGTMCITGIALTSIFFLKRNYLAVIAACTVLIIDLTYFSSSLHKIPAGGYWSIVLALFPYKARIEERAIFYGLEDIVAKGHWKLFAFIKRITPAFVSFFRLPSRKLHGVLTRIEM